MQAQQLPRPHQHRHDIIGPGEPPCTKESVNEILHQDYLQGHDAEAADDHPEGLYWAAAPFNPPKIHILLINIVLRLSLPLWDEGGRYPQTALMPGDHEMAPLSPVLMDHSPFSPLFNTLNTSGVPRPIRQSPLK